MDHLVSQIIQGHCNLETQVSPARWEPVVWIQRLDNLVDSILNLLGTAGLHALSFLHNLINLNQEIGYIPVECLLNLLNGTGSLADDLFDIMSDVAGQIIGSLCSIMDDRLYGAFNVIDSLIDIIIDLVNTSIYSSFCFVNYRGEISLSNTWSIACSNASFAWYISPARSPSQWTPSLCT